MGYWALQDLSRNFRQARFLGLDRLLEILAVLNRG